MTKPLHGIRLVAVLALLLCGRPCDPRGPAPAVTLREVLDGLQAFYRKTVMPDGSFRPGVDPDYRGMADMPSATWRRSPTPSFCTKRSAGTCPTNRRPRRTSWPARRRTAPFSRPRHRRPGGAATRVYNTTQELVALHALGVKPKYDPLPVFEQALDGDRKKLPLYTTSFFPLAYACLGKPFPAEQDRKVRAS